MSELKEKILDLRRKGYTYNKIHDMLSCSKGTISYHCKKNGLTNYKTKDQWKEEKICPCGKKIFNYYGKCQKCKNLEIRESIYTAIKENRYRNNGANLYYREYLSIRDGYNCSICSISDWNKKPIILRVDHIDGNSDNNEETNLRLVCHNCDSQLSTYCNKNKGKGGSKAKKRLEDYYDKK